MPPNQIYSYNKLSSNMIEIVDHRDHSTMIIDLEQARASLKTVGETQFATNAAYRTEREKWLGAIRILEVK